MMSAACTLCDGACGDAGLRPFLIAPLQWLWEQVGRAADRRGDPSLVEGSLVVRAPEAAHERAAAGGLLGSRTLKPGQSRTVDLAQLTRKLAVRGPKLTPGAVAAHALSRRLAVRAAARAERNTREQELSESFTSIASAIPKGLFDNHSASWAALRRAGWVSRLATADGGMRLLQSALSVISALPTGDARADRRHLAARVTTNPHALDHGSELARLVLALLVGGGRIESKQRPRAAWDAVGVDCDDVTGGLTSVGVLPTGWSLPVGAVVTMPRRVLLTCEWPSPSEANPWIFVTENPSIASAAADLASEGVRIRLLCTSGTPTHGELRALARLAAIGWQLAVRADFDAAGITHVNMMITAAPTARPWRMTARDYLESVPKDATGAVSLDRVPNACWDGALAATMSERGVAGFEESLLPLLLDDLRRGTPTAQNEP